MKNNKSFLGMSITEYLKIVKDDLYDLYNRLRENYNDDVEFEQKEEDRVIICNIIDAIDELESDNNA